MLNKLRTVVSRLRQNTTVNAISPYLPPINYITIHYAYIIFTSLVASAIFYISSSPKVTITYTDSLFLVISAITEAGLNTVNLSQMTTFQQFILWLLIVMGGSIFVSISTLWTRKRVFKQRFRSVAKEQRGRRGRRTLRRGGPDRGLEEQRKVDEPIDKSEFESRHSGPRDPTTNSSSGGSPAAKLSNQGGVDNLPSINIARAKSSSDPDRISVLHATTSGPSDAKGRNRVLNFTGIKEHSQATSSYKLPTAGGLTHRSGHHLQDPNEKDDEKETEIADSDQPYYLNRHTTGRNAQFHDLTRAERKHLGGVEYRALTFLSILIPAYWFLWQILGCLGLAAYFAHNNAQTPLENGINPWWLGIFNGASAFNNSGMSLLDQNMIPFRTSTYPIMTMGLMILAGNTAFPLFLRLICWSMLRIICLIYPSEEHKSQLKSTIAFILRYPRRVYTNLFPSTATWWLLFMVLILNGIDWIAFEVLNIDNPAVEAIPANFRVLDGLFQALAVRAGGFYIIAIPSLRIGLQVLYLIMMYISAYPVVITMRHSNVYEERSLGIYAEDSLASSSPSSFIYDEEATISTRPNTTFNTTTHTNNLLKTLKHTFIPPPQTQKLHSQFLLQQIRSQLAHDIWLLVLATWLITIIETSNIGRDPVAYSVFNIIFEVMSGYGCVGISTGVPNDAFSFAGGWKVCSKLVLCVVMIRGRHRGLPVALDRAVRLPEEDGEGCGRNWEEEDFEVRRSLSRRPDQY